MITDENIIGRTYPDDDPDFYIENLNYLLNDFLDNTKRDRIKSAELKALIERNDELSAIELCQIAISIREFIGRQPEWFQDYKQTLQTGDTDSIRGQTFELASAKNFCLKHQQVELCKINQPGYDFTILKNKLKFLVSCKKKQNSEEYSSFLQTADKIYHRTLQSIDENHKGSKIDIFCQSDKYNALDEDLFYNALWHKVNDFILNSRCSDMFMIDSYCCGIKRLSPSNAQYSFSNDTSLKLFISCKQHAKEQDKFIEVFKRAAKNIKSHTKDIGKTEMTMVMIGLPDYIDMDIASGWVTNEFERNFSSVFVTLLYRQLPANNLSNNINEISNEIRYIPNLQYRHDSPESNLRKLHEIAPIFKPEFGVIATASPTKKMILNGQPLNDTTDLYMFQKASEVYSINNGDGSVFNITLFPNTAYSFRLSDNNQLLPSPIIRHTDFVIL